MYAEAAWSQWGSWPPIDAGHIRSSTGVKWINDVDGVTAFHGVGEENGRLVERDKESLAHDEVGTYIGAGYRFRFIGDPAKEGGAVDFGRVSGGAKAQFVSADEL